MKDNRSIGMDYTYDNWKKLKRKTRNRQEIQYKHVSHAAENLLFKTKIGTQKIQT